MISFVNIFLNFFFTLTLLLLFNHLKIEIVCKIDYYLLFALCAVLDLLAEAAILSFLHINLYLEGAQSILR